MRVKDMFQHFYEQTYDAAIEYILLKTGDLPFSTQSTIDCYKTVLKSMQSDKSSGTDCTNSLYELLDKHISNYWKENRSFAPLSREVLMQQDAQSEQMIRSLQQVLPEGTDALPGETAANIVKNCLQPLPALQRRVFVLYFFFQKSIEESAALLEITPTAATLYISEVLQQILDAVSNYSANQ